MGKKRDERKWMTTIGYSLEKHQHRMINRIAKQMGLSRSAALRLILSHVREEGKKAFIDDMRLLKPKKNMLCKFKEGNEDEEEVQHIGGGGIVRDVQGDGLEAG